MWRVTTDYQIRFKDLTGALVAEVTDYISLAYTKRRREPGLHTILLNGDHASTNLLANDYQVEIWRRNADLGIAWYCDYYGLHRSRTSGYTDRNNFTSSGPGQLSLLDRRIIAYAASVANRSLFTGVAGETIMKTLVKYNATASGDASAGNTAGGFRARAATLSGFTITIEADGVRGNVVDWYCMGDNLLLSLQKLAQVAGGDFDLIKTGGATWDFRWYTGQRGTDRSASVEFSLVRGNMANPVYSLDRSQERTAAICAGTGIDTARTFVVRTGTDYAAADDIEVFVDGSNLATTAALNSLGDQKLDLARARSSFTYSVLQTKASAYGKHYCVNGDIADLIKATYLDVSKTQCIWGATVTSDAARNEQIMIEAADA